MGINSVGDMSWEIGWEQAKEEIVRILKELIKKIENGEHLSDIRVINILNLCNKCIRNANL